MSARAIKFPSSDAFHTAQLGAGSVGLLLRSNVAHRSFELFFTKPCSIYESSGSASDRARRSPWDMIHKLSAWSALCRRMFSIHRHSSIKKKIACAFLRAQKSRSNLVPAASQRKLTAAAFVIKINFHKWGAVEMTAGERFASGWASDRRTAAGKQKQAKKKGRSAHRLRAVWTTTQEQNVGHVSAL